MLRFESGEGLRRVARGSEMWFKATEAARKVDSLSWREHCHPVVGCLPHIAMLETRRLTSSWTGSLSFTSPGTSSTALRTPLSWSRLARRIPSGTPATSRARPPVLHAPALDHYFEELEQLWSFHEPPERSAEIELMRRHGMEPA